MKKFTRKKSFVFREFYSCKNQKKAGEKLNGNEKNLKKREENSDAEFSSFLNVSLLQCFHSMLQCCVRKLNENFQFFIFIKCFSHFSHEKVDENYFLAPYRFKFSFASILQDFYFIKNSLILPFFDCVFYLISYLTNFALKINYFAHRELISSSFFLQRREKSVNSHGKVSDYVNFS